MPKFLDAPSWYNVDGLETKANGVVFVNVATLDETTHNLYEKPDGIYVYECTSGSGLSLKIYATNNVYLNFWCTPGMQPIVVQKIQCVQTHVWEYYIDGYSHAAAQTGSPYSTSSGAITLMSGAGSGINGSIVRVSSNGMVTIYNQLFYGLNNQYGVQNTKFYAPTTGGTSGQILTSRGTNSAPSWVTCPVAHYIEVDLPTPNSGNLYFTFFDHDTTSISETNANDRLDFATTRLLPASGTIRIGTDYAIITHVQLFAGSFTAYGVSFSGGTITADNYSRRYGINEIDAISDSVLSLYS